MRTWPLILCVFACLAGGAASAQDSYRVLPQDFNADKQQQMMRAYLRRQVHEALDRRLEQLEEALGSAETIGEYQGQRRKFLRWTLGEMPERTPLNAEVTGVIKENDFAIEKVLFESQPGFYVTGNLYRPAGDGPFPAILHPCGHSENGKAAAAYQKANRLLVRNGFIVLCYDPIGQGERKQLLAEDGSSLYASTGEHQQLGTVPILLGRSLATYMVWDAVRAIDYLQSRPEVDAERIGCTGNSGGGNMTSFLMAYDDRIAAAAPGCFMTTHRRKNESPGPGDAEQNLFAQIREGFDHPDFIITRAPKPTLILAASRDFVPIEGTWEAFRQAKRVYTQLGYPERIDLVEANEQHGFSRRLREAALRFFAHWLQGRQIEVFEEEEVPVRADAELQVTPSGQVLELKGSRSLPELFADYEQQLAVGRPKLTAKIVRDVTAIRPLAQLPRPEVDQLVAEGCPRRLILRPEEGILLPALHWPGGEREPVVIAPDSGINSAVEEAARLHREGHPVLVVDVRDTGETKTRIWRFHGADYYIGYMLGRSWLAMRAEDLLVSARWLKETERADSVQLIAHGEVAPAAMHAAALERRLISDVQVVDTITSWRQLHTRDDPYAQLHNAVHGALRYYDLPDLQAVEAKP